MSLKKTSQKNDSALKIESLQKNSNFHLPLWLAMMIILAFIVIATVVIFYYYQKQEPAQKKELEISASPENLMPNEVHSYVGKILKIELDKIVIQALKPKNYLNKDTLLTVKINDNTQVTKLLIPQKLSGDPEKDKVKREEAEIKDLKVGDEILVYAKENIKDKIIFTADKIEIQSVF